MFLNYDEAALNLLLNVFEKKNRFLHCEDQLFICFQIL